LHGLAQGAGGSVRSGLRVAAALAGAALLVTGCSSARVPSRGDSGEQSVAGSGGQPSAAATTEIPSPTPTPYGTTLTGYVGPVNDALGKLGQAGSLDDLNTALGGAKQAAGDASSGLRSADVPDQIADANRQLYVALDQLATDLGQVQSDISGSKVCATSSALAETGQAQGLKDVPAALQALASAGYSTTFNVPQTPQPQHRSLDNGAFVREGQDDGNGELTVDNTSGSDDSVITLVKDGQSAYSFYVGKGHSAKITGIRDGSYDVYFAGGLDWDGASKKFTQNCAFSKFDDRTDFTTTDNTYSTYKITLQAVVGGNATTSDVPVGSYPVP
jgi:hypothetical protein